MSKIVKYLKWGCWTIFVPKKLHISTESGLLLLLENLSAYDDYNDWDLTKYVLPLYNVVGTLRYITCTPLALISKF
jgi:hypothetical protein